MWPQGPKLRELRPGMRTIPVHTKRHPATASVCITRGAFFATALASLHEATVVPAAWHSRLGKGDFGSSCHGSSDCATHDDQNSTGCKNRRLDSRPRRLHNGGTTQLTADICLHASAFRATPLTAVDSQLFALGTCKTTRIFGPTFCSFQPSRCRRFRVRGRALVLQGSGAPQDFSELLIKMADRKAHCSTKRSCEDPETFNPVQAYLPQLCVKAVGIYEHAMP